MAEYKTPGIYIEEISHLPTSIVSVETAIPAFIGYTEKAASQQPGDLVKKPWRIGSLQEYEQLFGYPDPEKESLSVAFPSPGSGLDVLGVVDETKRSKFLMHYSLQIFFANGGGPCWITSVGNYQASGGVITAQALKDGLTEVARINEPTLLLFPDAISLGNPTEYYDVYATAIDQCTTLQDRFTLLDVYPVPANAGSWQADVQFLRDTLAGTPDNLKYAAAYFPRIFTTVGFNYKVAGDQTTNNEATVKIINGPDDAQTLAELKIGRNAEYQHAKSAIANIPMLLPASAALAGIYAQVDKAIGVWKAPANINITNAIKPAFLLTNQEQETLNVDPQTGKSINAIRVFAGRGSATVWGARTLAGNDNEWRFIPVRRFFNMVEQSVKNATEQFVFEPNDEHTWVSVKSMIQNYLTQQWRAGALMGATPVQAFFVRLGLGETMTELDLQEGRMIVEIGMAVVRPAEFIILRFMHKMLQKS